jgi:hypothetical protein
MFSIRSSVWLHREFAEADQVSAICSDGQSGIKTRHMRFGLRPSRAFVIFAGVIHDKEGARVFILTLAGLGRIVLY